MAVIKRFHRKDISGSLGFNKICPLHDLCFHQHLWRLPILAKQLHTTLSSFPPPPSWFISMTERRSDTSFFPFILVLRMCDYRRCQPWMFGYVPMDFLGLKIRHFLSMARSPEKTDTGNKRVSLSSKRTGQLIDETERIPAKKKNLP